MKFDEKKRVWIALAGIGLLTVVYSRVSSLARVPRLASDLNEQRAAVLDWVMKPDVLSSDLPESLSHLGVSSVRFEQFDVDAILYLRPGIDGQPGVAGVDDNGNGVIDDLTELGATKSDDILKVTAGGIEPSEAFLVLQRGGYVHVTRDSATDSSTSSDSTSNNASGWRVVVTGRSNGENWSFQIPSPS